MQTKPYLRTVILLVFVQLFDVLLFVAVSILLSCRLFIFFISHQTQQSAFYQSQIMRAHLFLDEPFKLHLIRTLTHILFKQTKKKLLLLLAS